MTDGDTQTTIYPDSVEALRAAVTDAVATNQAIAPRGGGLDDFCEPTDGRSLKVIDMTGLGRVVDYPVEDMTITVEAGIRMATLNALLAANGQMLPFDAALSERATLGGVLATRWCGGRRFGYGAPRDYVLGIEFVDAKGRVVSAGGRVVKNVAGYDLMKLHIGARGTLGVIARATLRLRPLPEAQEAVVFDVPIDAIAGCLDRLNASSTRPVAVDLLTKDAASMLGVPMDGSAQAFKLVVLFEECREAVAWQVVQIVKELTAVRALNFITLQGKPLAAFLENLVDWPERPHDGGFCQAIMPPSQVPEFCRRLGAASTEAVIHAGNGVARFATPTKSESHAANALDPPADGMVIQLRRPRRTSGRHPQSLSSPGRPPLTPLMLQLKHSLDPKNNFNPTAF